jgi:hypothetical protein
MSHHSPYLLYIGPIGLRASYLLYMCPTCLQLQAPPPAQPLGCAAATTPTNRHLTHTVHLPIWLVRASTFAHQSTFLFPPSKPINFPLDHATLAPPISKPRHLAQPTSNFPIASCHLAGGAPYKRSRPGLLPSVTPSLETRRGPVPPRSEPSLLSSHLCCSSFPPVYSPHPPFRAHRPSIHLLLCEAALRKFLLVNILPYVHLA